MNNKLEKNISFNYKRKNKDKKYKTMKLFNCYFCGYHSKAIFKHFIKGFENECIIDTINLHPENEPELINISSDKIINDGILVKETICGKCGRDGHIEDIPIDLLQAMGYNIYKPTTNENSYKDKIIKKIKKFLK